MGITRKFIDWRNPALPETVDFLFHEFANDHVWDLDRVIVVVAGSRAGRRLTELMIDRAERESLPFLPPQITTLGALPELLYQPKRPFASKLVQKLAWVEALQSIQRRRLRRYIPSPPEKDELQRWLDLAELIWKQHRELAADGMSFADVARVGPQIEGFDEGPRWKFLSDVQESYLRILDSLKLWDRQTARLYALEHREFRTDQRIVLVGTVDMNSAIRQMVDQVADNVTSLIFAPEHFAARFDSHGCLLPQAWQKATLPVRREQVQPADDPRDVGEAVAAYLRRFEGSCRADQIKVGVPDERLAPVVGRCLSEQGVASRWVVGQAMPQTRVYQLLRSIGSFVSRLRYSEFASLVRHPDMHDYLVSVGLDPDWLGDLDRYYQEHLPPKLGDWLGETESCQRLIKGYAAVNDLLQPLINRQNLLSEWATELCSILNQVYGHDKLDREDTKDHFQLGSLSQIRNVLVEFCEIPESLMPTLTATQAIQMILESLRTATLPPPADPHALELLGWLELPWEEASVLVVAGMNEGIVPTSVNSDLFLPNSLRQRLGLFDNQRRYARDAYSLSVVLESTPNVHLLFARRDDEGDPMTPSRLLFACDREELQERALSFFDAEGAVETENESAVTVESASKDSAESSSLQSPRESAFFVPRPDPVARPITGISVTAFRTYLACPYRFYLRHVLKLDGMHDRDEEMNAPAFGNLIHEVLSRFGNSAVAKSAAEQEICDYLRSELFDVVTEQYGIERLPAIDVQTAQAQLRLDAFARWQASWANDGWEIRFTESPTPDQTAVLPLPNGREMKLYGRIDRIDYHPERDEWVIFDYKTSNEALAPERVHMRYREWVDLQLPLYLRLAERLDVPADAKLGYIALPSDLQKVGAQIAEWSEKQLAAADQVAIDVANNITAQKFWPPKYPPPRLLAEFGAICQDRVLHRRLAELESTA